MERNHWDQYELYKPMSEEWNLRFILKNGQTMSIIVKREQLDMVLNKIKEMQGEEGGDSV